MVVEETRRLALYKIAQEQWGDAGTTLIEMLPASGFEPASRHDVEHVRVELRAEILASRSDVDGMVRALRTDLETTKIELHADIGTLRTDLEATKHELRRDFATLRTDLETTKTELHSDMARLEARVATELAAVRGELQTQLREQTVRLLAFLVPSIVSGVALAFAAARLA